MITKKEHLLAALIFVLWSLGVVVLPAMGASAALSVPQALFQLVMWVYVALHVVIFAFALLTLAQRLRKERKRGWHKLLVVLLYGYATLMLSYSLYLLVPAAFGY